MAKNKMQVVFASAEVAPFVKTGGLGDVAGSLPQELVKDGCDVIVMCPKYASIPDEFKARMEHYTDFYVPLGWRNEYCGLEKIEEGGVTYLFVDNEHYFNRSYPYGFFDDGERFAFFSKAICESLQHLPAGFECDILHCNDWQTALAPVFLREFYQGLPLYERVKTIFTIHNIAFQGQFSDKMLNDVLGLAHIPNAARQLRCDSSSINFMQGALCYSDAITTVSPSYAREIKTSNYGEGLDWILRQRSDILSGILNGIDEPSWDPSTDFQIAENYGVGNMGGKAACKRALQQELGLEVRDDRPLMVMVSRLTRQKGMDLVTYSLDRILSGGVQVAVLGTGERAYEDAMNYFAGKYPGTMAARITFDSALSRRMYAGADLFLMPSLFEPCGLSQIIAMRYGTLPVVRETGGLRDTVIPYNYDTGEGTGFSFANFNGDEMGDAVFRGARLFWDNREAFNRVVEQAMKTDFSWTRSAGSYLCLLYTS
ncbi:glycogen synthase GlgA, partial [Collinsella intestinalis]|uniref:glycogen synthase GlgA n=1 Tax=Collinsella intestinalis TaxID=147207 RepID=UPI00195796C5